VPQLCYRPAQVVEKQGAVTLLVKNRLAAIAPVS
jgi:hypothetical protein